MDEMRMTWMYKLSHPAHSARALGWLIRNASLCIFLASAIQTQSGVGGGAFSVDEALAIEANREYSERSAQPSAPKRHPSFLFINLKIEGMPSI